MPNPLSPLAALWQVRSGFCSLPHHPLVMLSPNMSLLVFTSAPALPMPVMPLVLWPRCPCSPCSHCSLAEHIPSSSTFVHTQMSPGALLELAPGGSSALWASRAGLCAPGPLHPVAPRGLSPHPWQSTLRDLLCSVSVQSLMREGKERKKPS